MIERNRKVVSVIDGCADINISISSVWNASSQYNSPEALGGRKFHCCKYNVHWTGIDVK